MKLFLSSDLEYNQEKTRLMCEFILFCVEKLPIEGNFEIHVVAKRKPHNITTTAVYECGNNVCKIYAKDRALADVMRSIAHEMTHMMQDEMGLLVGHIKDAGGFHEDQANARAGELIKLFAKSKKDRKAIYESVYNNTINYLPSYNRLLGESSNLNIDFSGQAVQFDNNYYSESDIGGDSINPDASAAIKGKIFTVHGINFQSEPAEGAGNVASNLYDSCVKAGGTAGVKDWETTKAGNAWVSKNIYDASKEGSGKIYGPKLGTPNESFWSSWFFSVAYKGFKSEGGGGSNHFDYGGDEGIKKRKEVIEDPDSFKGKIVFMTFAPNEAPLYKGDAVFAHRGEKKGSGFKGILPVGPSHMRILIDDSGTVVGGNESQRVGKGKVNLNSDLSLAAGQKYSGEVYTAVYKRVKVLGKNLPPDDKTEDANESKTIYESSYNKLNSLKKLTSYNQITEGISRLNPTFQGTNVTFDSRDKSDGDGDNGIAYTGDFITTSNGKRYIGNSSIGLSPPNFWKNFRSELDAHIKKEYPELGFRIANLGVTRHMESAAVGGKGGAKIAGSKHGVGLAQDIYMHSKKYGEFTYFKKDNKALAKDKKFVDAIISFLANNAKYSKIRWGGAFSSGKNNLSPGMMPKERGILELHHFEFMDKFIPDFFKKFDKDIQMLTKNQVSASDMTRSSKRKILYQAVSAADLNPEKKVKKISKGKKSGRARKMKIKMTNKDLKKK